jgi:signal transduction histidine kinase
MAETLFEELKRYVEFGSADEAALRRLHELIRADLPAVVELFYQRILAHEGARQTLRDGEREVGRLRGTLLEWMNQLLSGPWDQVYFEARCRIGRVHVRIGLPQHYMFAAMNVVRNALDARLEEAVEPGDRGVARAALGKVLDLDLAVMLHSYRDDLLAQQARVERLSTFGQLAASIGHDLRNPLTVIETSVYVLRQRVDQDERYHKHVDRIGEQLRVANGIITNMLDMLRDRPLVLQPVVLESVVTAAAESVRRPEEISLLMEGLSELPPLQGDPGQLQQVFANLLENAVYAAQPRGEVRVRGSRRDDGLEVCVEDTGPGVDRAIAQRLFEPLVTNKAKGSGLGLALVKRIVERHGGKVGYSDAEGGGARFTVQLPL